MMEWEAILASQGGTCGVCDRVPANNKLVIDHEHVSGWKRMPPEERKKYVRGLTCTLDNHFVLTQYADAKRHREAARYLEKYERRRKRDS